MSNKHPHDAVIRAWLDGKTIQLWSTKEGKWKDISALKEGWNLYFSTDGQYRIKPTVIKYRMFLWKSNSGNRYVTTVTPEEQARKPRDQWAGFVRWIDTDWQEVEV